MKVTQPLCWDTRLAGVNKDGHDSGTTRAAVSDGTLVIRDQEKQTQDVASLSRDAENANGSINQNYVTNSINL